jgi:hypothetical protein
MRRLLLGFFLLLNTQIAAAQSQPDVADRASIRGVISNQIEAFRRNDATAAFGYATPNIQSVFGNAENFVALVETAYLPVWRPRDVQFGAIEDRDGRIVQKVELIGPDGAPVLALYSMERGSDGVWRIDGCALLPSEKLSV